MMCPTTREEYGEDSSMWYVDDPRPLKDRRNWTPEKMNELLQREALCSIASKFCNGQRKLTSDIKSSQKQN